MINGVLTKMYKETYDVSINVKVKYPKKRLTLVVCLSAGGAGYGFRVALYLTEFMSQLKMI